METVDLEPIDDRLLDQFVTQKYHWQSLSPKQQMAMAMELVYLRTENAIDIARAPVSEVYR